MDTRIFTHHAYRGGGSEISRPHLIHLSRKYPHELFIIQSHH